FILAANNILMRIGGEGGVAVFGVVLNISYIALCLYDATGATLQPLISTFIGEKNKTALRATRRLSFAWGMGLSALLIFAVFIFAENICGFFGLRADISQGVYAVRLFCIGAVFAGVSIIASAYFQAGGRARWSFAIGLLRNCIVLLPLALLLGLFGPQLFWWVFPITEGVSLAVWMLIRRLGRHKNTEKDMDRSRIYSRMIENKNEDIRTLLTEVESFCEKWEADVKQSYYVLMAVEEICNAIIQNAFGGNHGEYIQLTLIANGDGIFELHVRDNAILFNPFDMITKKVDIEDSERELDSLGMLMIKNKSKDFFYRRYQGFNTLTVKV
ncbi:MAG: MATE family efflux transporter, partial [Eubacteriales bacterium]